MSEGALSLPHCEACHRAHWPAREICPHCLGEPVVWRQADGGGRVLATAKLHHSLSPEFRAHLPMHVATVALDCGVRAIVYLEGGPLPSGARINVTSGQGPSGQDALVAASAPR